MTVVEKYRKQGCNCAETVVKAFNEEFGQSLPPQVATAFGGGLSSGDACGAVAGAVMALSMLYGRQEPDQENRVGEKAARLVEHMREKYGSVDCRDLKTDRAGCDRIVDAAYAALKEIIGQAQ